MIEIALVTSLLILTAIPRATHQDAPPPIEDQLVVLVVDDRTGQPVQGAEVLAFDLSTARLRWRSRGYNPDHAEWRSERERLAVRERTDASGRAGFPGVEGEVELCAQAPGLWAESRVEVATSAHLELRLEPDVTLEVAVIDESGAPVGDMAVELVQRATLGGAEPDSRPFESSALVECSDQADGVARFLHAQTVVRQGEDWAWFARLAIPLAAPVEVALDATQLGAQRPQLLAPATGSLSIACPAIQVGRARIRRVPEEKLSAWLSWMPLRTSIADGKARFPHVGLGLVLEYELYSGGTGYLQKGTIKGPVIPAERVEWTCPSDASYPVLVGRAVDEAGAPIRSTAELYLNVIQRDDAGAQQTSGHRVALDAEGRFELVLREDRLDSGISLAIQIAGDGVESHEVELPGSMSPSQFDLGDIQLIALGSVRWLADKEDAFLEAEYRRAALAGVRNLTYQCRVRIEASLTEMVRRGGRSWEAFLEAELARVRSGQEETDVADLEVLTALRRVQRLPDPLAVEIDATSILECTFPIAPTIRVRLRNVDARGESFQLAMGSSDDRLAHCRVEAFDVHRTRLEPLPESDVVGHLLFGREPFASGGSLSFHLPLGRFVQWTQPGEYQVRIGYHDRSTLADHPDLEGWIVSSSEPLPVRVAPLKLQLTRAEIAGLARHIEAIDVSQKVFLVNRVWDPELEFEGEPTTPQDHLFRAGWRSIPALLEALESDALEPQRLAWVLGMLWNVTGIYDPSSRRALGSFDQAEFWPGASSRRRTRKLEVGASGAHWFQSDVLQDLRSRWLALRSLVEVTVVD